jgi:cation diffusion facilitator family transporter
MPTSHRERRGLFAVNLGLLANIGLAGLKTTVGILGHSQALLADGINSVSDVIYYVLVSIFVRLAGKPPDEEHPYGHRQLESVAALIVGAFVLTTAVALFWDAANSVYAQLSGGGRARVASMLTLYVALFTVLSKLVLVAVTRRIGQQTRNAAIIALASDHRNDVFSALAVTIGITLGRLGYSWVDPLAGAIVALVIFRTGLEIMQEGISDIMQPLPADMLRQEITAITCNIPGVRDVEEIHAHRFGPYLVLNITIGIDGGLTVSQGDAIATAVKHAVMEHDEYIRRVHIHYHPVGMSTGTNR